MWKKPEFHPLRFNNIQFAKNGLPSFKFINNKFNIKMNMKV